MSEENTRHPLLIWAVTPDSARTQLDTIAELDARGVDAVILPGGVISEIDPILVAGAASRRSPHVGLIPSFSPWIQPPFHTARALTTLDALTSGRAGWFAQSAASTFVSTDDTPRCNPSSVTDAEELDAACADYLDACLALWNSWEPGALIADVEAGQYVDPSKVHVTDYRGPFFSVRGPLNVPRSPQGRPPVLANFIAAKPVGASQRADVLIVDIETDVTAARHSADTVLFRIDATTVAEPQPTRADGYLISGVSRLSDAALYGHVVHVVLPELLGSAVRPTREPTHLPQGQLLRDRLHLSPADFEWKPQASPTTGNLAAKKGSS